TRLRRMAADAGCAVEPVVAPGVTVSGTARRADSRRPWGASSAPGAGPAPGTGSTRTACGAASGGVPPGPSAVPGDETGLEAACPPGAGTPPAPLVASRSV